MYSNNIVNFQEIMTILNAHTKKSLETYHLHLVVCREALSFNGLMVFVLDTC